MHWQQYVLPCLFPFERRQHYNSSRQTLITQLSSFCLTEKMIHTLLRSPTGFYLQLDTLPPMQSNHRQGFQHKHRTITQMMKALPTAGAYIQEEDDPYTFRFAEAVN